jgi:hypothetical protein
MQLAAEGRSAPRLAINIFLNMVTAGEITCMLRMLAVRSSQPKAARLRD